MPQTQHPTTNNKQWCTFTYTGKKTAFITKLFKHTNIKIAFRASNNIWKHLSQPPPEHDKYKQSGVYKLTCPNCGKAYIGQTDREFHTRFNEHKRAFHHNPRQSKFALHLTEQKYSFGHINNITQIVQPQKKGGNLNTIERFYKYKEAHKSNHLNDDLTIAPTNKIFDTTITQLT
jgi:hypothetical protein